MGKARGKYLGVTDGLNASPAFATLRRASLFNPPSLRCVGQALQQPWDTQPSIFKLINKTTLCVFFMVELSQISVTIVTLIQAKE